MGYTDCQLLAVSAHGGRGKGTLLSLFYKGINHFSKASFPNTITLGIKISTHEFGGHTNIQSIVILFIRLRMFSFIIGLLVAIKVFYHEPFFNFIKYFFCHY